MAIKKAIYKVDNGSGFDEIYFKTSAEQIEESSSRRFVTDTEKSNWNGKASTSIASKTTNGLMASSDKSKLDGIASGANAYVHPGTHPATMITGDSTHRFVTESEKSYWNAKASTSLASSTANGLMSIEMVKKLNGITAVKVSGDQFNFNSSAGAYVTKFIYPKKYTQVPVVLVTPEYGGAASRASVSAVGTEWCYILCSPQPDSSGVYVLLIGN